MLRKTTAGERKYMYAYGMTLCKEDALVAIRYCESGKNYNKQLSRKTPKDRREEEKAHRKRQVLCKVQCSMPKTSNSAAIHPQATPVSTMYVSVHGPWAPTQITSNTTRQLQTMPYGCKTSCAPLSEDTTSTWLWLSNGRPWKNRCDGRGGTPTHPRISEGEMRSYSRHLPDGCAAVDDVESPLVVVVDGNEGRNIRTFASLFTFGSLLDVEAEGDEDVDDVAWEPPSSSLSPSES